MKAKKIRLTSHVAVVALALLALTACDPFAKEKAEQAEKTRIECLDKLCYGDIIPKFDSTKDSILKLNGQWYVGPKEYFSSGINGAYFFGGKVSHAHRRCRYQRICKPCSMTEKATPFR
jgi:hypothetical protein